MKQKAIEKVKTKEEARDLAIKWQAWQSRRSTSYAEAADWGAYFYALARKFNLVREYKENGII